MSEVHMSHNTVPYVIIIIYFIKITGAYEGVIIIKQTVRHGHFEMFIGNDMRYQYDFPAFQAFQIFPYFISEFFRYYIIAVTPVDILFILPCTPVICTSGQTLICKTVGSITVVIPSCMAGYCPLIIEDIGPSDQALRLIGITMQYLLGTF